MKTRKYPTLQYLQGFLEYIEELYSKTTDERKKRLLSISIEQTKLQIKEKKQNEKEIQSVC